MGFCFFVALFGSFVVVGFGGGFVLFKYLVLQFFKQLYQKHL